MKLQKVLNYIGFGGLSSWFFGTLIFLGLIEMGYFDIAFKEFYWDVAPLLILTGAITGVLVGSLEK